MGNLRSLRKLDLMFNRANVYVPGSKNLDLMPLFRQADGLRNLRELNLEYMNLRTLPDDVARFHRLKTLRLGYEYPLRERERIRRLLPNTSVTF